MRTLLDSAERAVSEPSTALQPLNTERYAGVRLNDSVKSGFHLRNELGLGFTESPPGWEALQSEAFNCQFAKRQKLRSCFGALYQACHTRDGSQNSDIDRHMTVWTGLPVLVHHWPK
jgi:hypothetical protein